MNLVDCTCSHAGALTTPPVKNQYLRFCVRFLRGSVFRNLPTRAKPYINGKGPYLLGGTLFHRPVSKTYCLCTATGFATSGWHGLCSRSEQAIYVWPSDSDEFARKRLKSPHRRSDCGSNRAQFSRWLTALNTTYPTI